MNFSFTEEQELFRKSVRRFCEEKIVPRADEIDDNAEIPHDLIDAMGSFGLLGITVSRDLGGAGAGFTEAAIVAEEIARADMSMAAAVYYLVGAGWGFIIDRYAGIELKKEVLPEVVKGKSFLGIASTEAKGGSDISALATTLDMQGETLLLDGSKAYISGVREAYQNGGGFVTIAKTAPQLAHKGLSLCYLPVKDMPGVSVSVSRQMGREGISNGFIQMNKVALPRHYLIGEMNRGFYYAMEGFNCARTLVAAACIGAAEKALEAGMDYIRRRKAFSSQLAKFQGIQFNLAENYVKLESARLLVYKAAWMLDMLYREKRFGNQDINKAVAAAKLSAPTAAFDIIRDVMLWHGAYGYTREAGLERGLRGVASYIVGAEGAQNIMKIIIGREILGKEFFPS